MKEPTWLLFMLAVGCALAALGFVAAPMFLNVNRAILQVLATALLGTAATAFAVAQLQAAHSRRLEELERRLREIEARQS
jgi:hypothetical protein